LLISHVFRSCVLFTCPHSRKNSCVLFFERPIVLSPSSP
jgi:hypothetical protein